MRLNLFVNAQGIITMMDINTKEAFGCLLDLRLQMSVSSVEQKGKFAQSKIYVIIYIARGNRGFNVSIDIWIIAKDKNKLRMRLRCKDAEEIKTYSVLSEK